MNKNIIHGKWNEIKGEVKKNWGALTDDHLQEINGDRLKLIGQIEKSYGVARDQAEKQVEKWEKSRNVA